MNSKFPLSPILGCTRHCLVLAALWLAPGAWCAGVGEADTVLLDRVQQRSRLSEHLLTLAWQNPVARQWRHLASLSQVAAGYGLRHETQAVVTQLGDHNEQWTFDASTHIRHNTSTLWGGAHYDNGSTRGIAWNETSDFAIVYPYLLADSAALAPLRHERYAFGGGYADHRGRFHWGGEADYEAGHYYRNVDPRPRNVTARLTVRGGAGLSLSPRYVADVALGYVKYKQTNDVAFYSELGKEKLYHLTGLGNDYGRFAGVGDDCYYHGHQWQLMLGVVPVDRQGVAATVSAMRMTMDKVITSLNKLPLAHITHTALNAEAAWAGAGWGVTAHIDAARRTGRENIFGDPASSVYRQIAALDMYRENRFSTGVAAVWQHDATAWTLDVRPAVDYNHLNAIYADPQCRQRNDDLTTAITLRGGWRTPNTHSTLTLGTAWTHPTHSELSLTGTKPELEQLQLALERDHCFASHNRTAVAAALAVSVSLNASLALQATLAWQCTAYTGNNRAHRLNTQVALIF